MARSTKSYEERMLQLEKKEQESLEKAKQYAAQKRELKKRQKDVETKKRTHRLCQIGGAVCCRRKRKHESRRTSQADKPDRKSTHTGGND